MKFRIRIAEKDFEELRTLLLSDLPRQTEAVMLAGKTAQGDTTDILLRRVISIPVAHYEIKEQYQLPNLAGGRERTGGAGSRGLPQALVVRDRPVEF